MPYGRLATEDELDFLGGDEFFQPQDLGFVGQFALPAPVAPVVPAALPGPGMYEGFTPEALAYVARSGPLENRVGDVRDLLADDFQLYKQLGESGDTWGGKTTTYQAYDPYGAAGQVFDVKESGLEKGLETAAKMTASLAATAGLGAPLGQLLQIPAAFAPAVGNAILGGISSGDWRGALAGGLGSLAQAGAGELAGDIGKSVAKATDIPMLGDVASSAVRSAVQAAPGAILADDASRILTAALTGGASQAVGALTPSLQDVKIVDNPNLNSALINAGQDLVGAVIGSAITGKDINVVNTILPSVSDFISAEFKVPRAQVNTLLNTAVKVASGDNLSLNDVVKIGALLGSQATDVPPPVEAPSAAPEPIMEGEEDLDLLPDFQPPAAPTTVEELIEAMSPEQLPPATVEELIANLMQEDIPVQEMPLEFVPPVMQETALLEEFVSPFVPETAPPPEQIEVTAERQPSVDYFQQLMQQFAPRQPEPAAEPPAPYYAPPPAYIDGPVYEPVHELIQDYEPSYESSSVYDYEPPPTYNYPPPAYVYETTAFRPFEDIYTPPPAYYSAPPPPPVFYSPPPPPPASYYYAPPPVEQPTSVNEFIEALPEAPIEALPLEYVAPTEPPVSLPEEFVSPLVPEPEQVEIVGERPEITAPVLNFEQILREEPAYEIPTTIEDLIANIIETPPVETPVIETERVEVLGERPPSVLDFEQAYTPETVDELISQLVEPPPAPLPGEPEQVEVTGYRGPISEPVLDFEQILREEPVYTAPPPALEPPPSAPDQSVEVIGKRLEDELTPVFPETRSLSPDTERRVNVAEGTPERVEVVAPRIPVAPIDLDSILRGEVETPERPTIEELIETIMPPMAEQIPVVGERIPPALDLKSILQEPVYTPEPVETLAPAVEPPTAPPQQIEVVGERPDEDLFAQLISGGLEEQDQRDRMDEQQIEVIGKRPEELPILDLPFEVTPPAVAETALPEEFVPPVAPEQVEITGQRPALENLILQEPVYTPEPIEELAKVVEPPVASPEQVEVIGQRPVELAEPVLDLESILREPVYTAPPPVLEPSPSERVEVVGKAAPEEIAPAPVTRSLTQAPAPQTADEMQRIEVTVPKVTDLASGLPLNIDDIMREPVEIADRPTIEDLIRIIEPPPVIPPAAAPAPAPAPPAPAPAPAPSPAPKASSGQDLSGIMALLGMLAAQKKETEEPYQLANVAPGVQAALRAIEQMYGTRRG